MSLDTIGCMRERLKMYSKSTKSGLLSESAIESVNFIKSAENIKNNINTKFITESIDIIIFLSTFTFFSSLIFISLHFIKLIPTENIIIKNIINLIINEISKLKSIFTIILDINLSK